MEKDIVDVLTALAEDNRVSERHTGTPFLKSIYANDAEIYEETRDEILAARNKTGEANKRVLCLEQGIKDLVHMYLICRQEGGVFNDIDPEVEALRRLLDGN